jgi:ubiquinol-cytochrome c reductase cytochrome b subunit
MRIWYKNLFFWILQTSAIFYKSPSNLSYFWNFGFYALLFLILQIITGIFLAMFYNPNPLFAFNSIIDLNNDVYFGWLMRSLHANGASCFFLIVYIHMARGIYYGSYVYPRELLWVSGVLLWILMIITAFLGYVLPWGQMSFWGAIVITSLLAAIPFIGNDFILLLWGGFSIDFVTLHRFYSLHYFLPFVILIVSIIHLCFLHEFGSNNLLGISCYLDNVSFVSFYLLKDSFSLVFLFFIFFIFIFLAPDFLGHPDNYQIANFLVTPSHIVPEWYFLPLYAVLRSVTDKLLGITLLFFMILFLFLLPFISFISLIRISFFRPFFSFFFWFLIIICFILCWLGSLPVMLPYVTFGVYFSLFYFFLFLLCFPFLHFFDKFIYICYIRQAFFFYK